jgi:hypothetical protein
MEKVFYSRVRTASTMNVNAAASIDNPIMMVIEETILSRFVARSGKYPKNVEPQRA